MSSPDLFAWADEQSISETKVIEFRTRRAHLRRWQWLEEHQPFRNLDLVIDRQDGRAPPVRFYQLKPSRFQAHTGASASRKVEDDAAFG